MPDSRHAQLNSVQQQRRDCAIRTLAASRVADLAALTPAACIVMIESLRSALDDSLRMIGELSDPIP
ncbi:hypothetical protein ACIGD1_11085 [Streptomyces sp. NPDC085612]|uniref:hypothetical protein n=1 Tax=Streptomyces sp. NPDC085612 TaxID=3365732 RepID=UPI0037D9817E